MAASVHTPEQSPADKRPWRTLLWIAVAGLIFGALGVGMIIEDVLRTTRNSLHWQKASGDIVLVRVDDESLNKIGRWPWPRRFQAKLIDELSSAGAQRIFVDFEYIGQTSPSEDRVLAEALSRSGRVVLPVRIRPAQGNEPQRTVESAPQFAKRARAGTITVAYNYQNAVWRLPYSLRGPNGPIDTFAALLGGKPGNDGQFTIDYSIDPRSVPTVSAVSVLSGATPGTIFDGKDVVIGQTTNVLGDTYFIPGTGQMGGAYVHILGAETLKQGSPLNLGWIPAFLAALAIAAWALLRTGERRQLTIVAISAAALAVGPAALENRLIFLDVVPALFVLVTTAAVLLRRHFRKSGLVNAVSGLPNLTALKTDRSGRDKALIVARVLNYAEVVAALPTSSERQLVDQIVARLSVGARDRVHFHGDDGIFAWFDEARKPFGHHLEALHALFRTPVRLAEMPIDLSVSFGVELGSSRTLANRLGSALVAADEAAHEGLKWKRYDPDSLQNASWKLSMLSQLDEAVDRGEVWVAYQPKVDLRTRRIIGAEALARWTHPEKGPVAAAEFIAAAEQHDRIGKLTAFVLDQAIAAAAGLGHGQRDFDMSVNLSGRLLGDRRLVAKVATLLERHGVDARQLTLELTETAALAGSGEALDMLAQLRELGVNISIDDYGTGLSTLEYLKRIPAAEIKIDQSFIRGMVENRSERLMVSSTIALAHSLGRRVVAEGVETRESLELLAEMECDIVQGFITGRPMTLENLRRRLTSDRRPKVA